METAEFDEWEYQKISHMMCLTDTARVAMLCHNFCQ